MIPMNEAWMLEKVVSMGNEAFRDYQTQYLALPTCKSLKGEEYHDCMMQKSNCLLEKTIGKYGDNLEK